MGVHSIAIRIGNGHFHFLFFFFSVLQLHSLWEVVFSTASTDLSAGYRQSVYRFLNKLLLQTAAEPTDQDLDNLCQTLLNLDKADEDRLEHWIRYGLSASLESLFFSPRALCGVWIL